MQVIGNSCHPGFFNPTNQQNGKRPVGIACYCDKDSDSGKSRCKQLDSDKIIDRLPKELHNTSETDNINAHDKISTFISANCLICCTKVQS